MTPTGVVAWSLRTPFGEGDATIEAIFAGRDAFAPVSSPHKLRNPLAATIARPAGVDTDGAWQRHLAKAVLRDALDALPEHHTPGERSAFIFATSFGHLLDDDGDDRLSTWARDCLRDLGFGQQPILVASGCSAGADALGIAAALLDTGATDLAIVVAVDIVTQAKRLAHSMLGTMTGDTLRPFDVARGGMLLGDAAAAVALARPAGGAGNHGELLGVGASNDAYGLTAPDPSGLSVRLALDRALAAAGLASGNLALYLAHGTGTELNDALEADVVAEFFSDNPALAAVGTKGALGHSLGACGLVEFILLLQMLRRRHVPTTVGLGDPLRAIAPRLAPPEGRALPGNVGVSVTLGFGGFNTALVARA